MRQLGSSHLTKCDRLTAIELMLSRILFPSGVMPLVPEPMRTYPSSDISIAVEFPGIFEANCFWGCTDDDYFG